MEQALFVSSSLALKKGGSIFSIPNWQGYSFGSNWGPIYVGYVKSGALVVGRFVMTKL